MVQHRPGATVTLTCRARGHPQPRVIWRFNWGCLPEELRMSGSRFEVRSTVEACSTRTPTVISTLTIRNFRNGDDGIYNCEALSGPHRALSDDMVVRIEP
ncbi:unnamed protein product [Protopolystoma xenopodis]|uniref:Ig-like domain-containing protein n=1 Tax=Protopolystoma xenopodis TaxID=117903 RepID=A0A448WTJ3_9PLAT|nr:unnamed protein product [Protopolystoma xenopodis]